MANREAQMKDVRLGPDIAFDFRRRHGRDRPSTTATTTTCSPTSACSRPAWEAAEEGFDAICIDTMSDSGANALRSVLDIPVITPGASFLTALMLGHSFSVLTQWDPWLALYKKGLQEYGLTHLCASMRSINVPPDVENLLGGKEEDVFPKLVEAGLRCVEDGAERHLPGVDDDAPGRRRTCARTCRCRSCNPGPADLRARGDAARRRASRQSRTAYPRPAACRSARWLAAMLARRRRRRRPRPPERSSAPAAAAPAGMLKGGLTQRKPMWLMPVSIICGSRAAGR